MFLWDVFNNMLNTFLSTAVSVLNVWFYVWLTEKKKKKKKKKGGVNKYINYLGYIGVRNILKHEMPTSSVTD